MAVDIKPLGVIHREYNAKVKEVITNNVHSLGSEFKPGDNDMENLLNIDIASHRRNIEYIVSVLKCQDSLYVSRVLKTCTWLFTEQQYAHVINPEYIQTHLLPHMYTKNYVKFLKAIQLTLKDENRAERFYLSEKEPKKAMKWLPICSVSFIESMIVSHIDHLDIRTFKRLCEKSCTIFEAIMRKLQKNMYRRNTYEYFQAVTFMLHVNPNLYLDFLECMPNYCRKDVSLNEKATDLIMKHAPQRVKDKFEKYAECIHVPTFVKHLKKDSIKIFLYEQAIKRSTYNCSVTYDNIRYFIKRLPREEQFKFVKDVFIDKLYENIPTEDLTANSELYGMMMLSKVFKNEWSFAWYEYATFETAHTAYIKIITDELKTTPENKYQMLLVLVKCANHNTQHMRTLLQYFQQDTKRLSNYLKFDFMTKLLEITHINDYDESTWDVLNHIFNDMGIYEESSFQSNDESFVQFIIIYNILHGFTIPTILINKFKFNTLKSYRTAMNREQREMVFSYLYSYLMSKLNNPIISKEQLTKSIEIVRDILNLLLDWEKELVDYPVVLNTIKDFFKLNKEHSWKVNLEILYIGKKSWWRNLFSEFLSIQCNEDMCLNALKHEPQLIAKNNTELQTLFSTNGTSPHRLLTKLRVYWSDTISQKWIDEYFQLLNDDITREALVRGLCTLLPQEQLMNTININVPKNFKIDGSETEKVVSLRRFIASNMHVARPQPPPKAVLLYAKGDYLKFALPSLLAIYHNLSPILYRENIYKILDAPVSLQKHGLRMAYYRFNDEELNEIILNSWKSSRNLTIRSVIFNITFKLLCREKEDDKLVKLWALLEMFIENLSFEEDKKIYELLFNVEEVPFIIRGKFLMKSYYFFKKFLPNAKNSHENYENHINKLEEYSRHVIELLSEEFVISLINTFMENKYFKRAVNACPDIIPVISAYLLSCKDEQTQMQRYKGILLPIMQRSLQIWKENSEEQSFIRSNFETLLYKLSDDLIYVVSKNYIVPTKMFLSINIELMESLSLEQNYLMITKWKLITVLSQLLEKVNYKENNDWNDISNKIAQEFGQKCLEYLKEDTKGHFTCIYLLFAKAFESILDTLIPEDGKIAIYELFLSDIEFIPAYLLTINNCDGVIQHDNGESYKKIKELLSNHKSVEVMFHYGNRIQNFNINQNII